MKRIYSDNYAATHFSDKRPKREEPNFTSNSFIDDQNSFFRSSIARANSFSRPYFNSNFNNQHFNVIPGLNRFQPPYFYNNNRPGTFHLQPYFYDNGITSRNMNNNKSANSSIDLKRKHVNTVKIGKNILPQKRAKNETYDATDTKEPDDSEDIEKGEKEVVKKDSKIKVFVVSSESEDNKVASGLKDLFSEDDEFIKQLTNEITMYCCRNAQTDESYSKKVFFKNYLERTLNNPLYIVGSSCNGLATVDSDMDLCYRMPAFSEINKNTKSNAIKCLMKIKAKLGRLNNIGNVQVIFARVPIMKFLSRQFNFQCDLNINNLVGIRNSHLIKAYSKIDVRLKMIVLYIKFWARRHKINDASQGTLSSYSLSLLAIHYLQYGCNPPILPNLQKLCPMYFDPERSVEELTGDNNLSINFESKNKKSSGALFVGFLDYYTNSFNFETDLASVRLGRRLKKMESAELEQRQWPFIGIEEPFDRSNTARAVVTHAKFHLISQIFKLSYRTLVSTKKISSILTKLNI